MFSMVVGSPEVVAPPPPHSGFQICSHTLRGHAIHLPYSVSCDSPHREPVYSVKAMLWRPRDKPASITAYKCFRKRRQVCTYKNAIFSTSIYSDKTWDATVTLDECLTAHEEIMTWNQTDVDEKYQKLTGGVVSTREQLELKWKWCCAPECFETNNLFIIDGGIASYDGLKIFSDLGDTSGCTLHNTNCKAKSYYILWDQPSAHAMSPYVSEGPFEAQISGKHVLIREANIALTLPKNKTNYQHLHHTLPKDIEFTEQGLGIQVLWDKKTENYRSHLPYWVLDKKFQTKETGVAPGPMPTMPNTTEGYETDQWFYSHQILNKFDPQNAKLQYLYDTITMTYEDNFIQMLTQVCHNAQRMLNTVWQLLRIDPTLAARAFLERDDIYAVFQGQAFQIWQCRPVKIAKVHWDYEREGICYDKAPVTLDDGTVMYAVPGTRDLVKTAHKLDCNHIVNAIYCDDKLHNWVDSDSQNAISVGGESPIQR
jgi:hypothetical protein